MEKMFEQHFAALATEHIQREHARRAAAESIQKTMVELSERMEGKILELATHNERIESKLDELATQQKKHQQIAERGRGSSLPRSLSAPPAVAYRFGDSGRH